MKQRPVVVLRAIPVRKDKNGDPIYGVLIAEITSQAERALDNGSRAKIAGPGEVNVSNPEQLRMMGLKPQNASLILGRSQKALLWTESNFPPVPQQMTPAREFKNCGPALGQTPPKVMSDLAKALTDANRLTHQRAYVPPILNGAQFQILTESWKTQNGLQNAAKAPTQERQAAARSIVVKEHA